MIDQVKKVALWVLAALVAGLLFSIVPLYVDWLWFKDVGYQSVFNRIMLSRLALGVATGALFFSIVYGNAYFALKSSSRNIQLYTTEGALPIFLDRMIRKAVEAVVLLSSIVVSIMVGLEASTHWESFTTFINYIPFGKTDPVFGNDISFYVFRLDFLQFLYRTLTFALVAAAAATAALLYLTRTVDFLRGKLRITGVAAGQLGALLALIAALQAVGIRLGAYQLLFTEGSALYGIGYTDEKVRLLASVAAMFAALIGAGIVLYASRKRSLELAVLGLFLGWIVNTLIGGGVAAIVQRLVVNPDELGRETPYLKRHIAATQFAYDLHDVVRTEANISGTLTPSDLKKNEVTLKSVRLWDYRPLQSAYKQLQEIQQYYSFEEVDIDRYMVDGVYRQVMLSARELDSQSLPSNARTWVNLRLKYTHGYGLAMSPVNEVSAEGLPQFFIKDIPSQSQTGFDLKRPHIYFGEQMDEYVLVNTAVDEFHYPKGSTGVETRFDAESGVRLGNIFRRAVLALNFRDLNILLPGNLKSDSRILFRRNIQDRVRKIAPFLSLDNDPYLVVHENGLMWIQDAYTVSDKYPYSQPPTIGGEDGSGGRRGGINYIRNSVKVTIDAYTGEVTLYTMNTGDPVLKVWEKTFPGMFKSASEMPGNLLNHIRYPEDLFQIQTRMYQNYHMSNVQQFYNKGDVWAIPTLDTQADNGGTARGPMEPYYVMMKLPDGDREEFILLMPYSRANKDNMVAWMAAKCDQPDYGKLILYEFPKGEQFYGPAQIQARANQDTEISEQLTLWNQQQSNVSRGNLLVIPIEDSVLYVEPLYLQATNAKIPELKRVIVAYGNQITMRETLGEALDELIGRGAGEAVEEGQSDVSTPQRQPVDSPGREPQAAPTSAITRARRLYNEAVAAQKRGDWAEYGRKLEELGRVLGSK